jgi:hypothetical protein
LRQPERHEQQLTSARTTIDPLVAQRTDAGGAVGKVASETAGDEAEMTALRCPIVGEVCAELIDSRLGSI